MQEASKKLEHESLGRVTHSLTKFSTLDNLKDNLRIKLDFILTNAMNDERPYLNVNILGRQLPGLLDSGATRTILGGKGFDIIKNMNFKLISSDIPSIKVANAQLCPVIGEFAIPFKVRDKTCIINTLVAPSIPHLLVLGVDFWRKFGVIPDLRHGEWTFADDMQVDVPNECELNSFQQVQLSKILDKHFSYTENSLGCTNLVKHKIRTTSEPIRQRFYRLSQALQKVADDELKQMLSEDIIEPSSSPWSSPIILVKKKDGNYRFCVDYRRVNAVSERDAYPLPFVSETLDKLRNAQFLSCLDIKSAYWQIEVEEESRPITAFTVPNRGLFQFKRMPFGLANAPATWQRLIDRVLGSQLEPYVFVYLDDIVIVTPTFEKHLEILEEVLNRLKNANLKVSREKCKFCCPQIKYLGYIVDKNGLSVDPSKVESILNLPPPKNVKDVRRIIGIASWYRRFIPNFSALCSPICDLLKKNRKFEWTSECIDAFDRLKELLISAPILTCPDFEKPFVISTDASDFGLGAVLTQNLDDGEHVIGYSSRSLNKNERRYSTTEKECLAVLFAIEKFRPYVEGSHFTVYTDHHSLIWLSNLKDPTGRLGRWSLKLQQYDFTIVHRRGKDNIVPDALSRGVTCDEIGTNNLFKNHKDSWYTKMITKILENPIDYPKWKTENEILYKRFKNKYPDLSDTSNEWKIVVPKGFRTDIIKRNHDLPTAGHGGIFKTFCRVSNEFYWPKMKSDIVTYVKNCTICLAHKVEQKAPIGQMCGRPHINKPWQLICVDLVGPLPKSTHGYMYILSIVDYFSKFPFFFPLRSINAKNIATILEDNVFMLTGVPDCIVCDNGKQFQSHIFKNLAAKYNIKLSYTALYHPQANAVERVHRVLKTMLSSYVSDHQRDWDTYLQKVACAIRSSKSEATGLTPYFINFGHEMIISRGPDQSLSVTYDGTVERDRSKLDRSKGFESIYRDVRERLDRAYDKNRQVYNLRKRDNQFTVGDKVWHRNFVNSDASRYFSSRLAPKFVGPFVVHKKLSPWTYELKNENGRVCGVYHSKDLKAHPPDSNMEF